MKKFCVAAALLFLAPIFYAIVFCVGSAGGIFVGYQLSSSVTFWFWVAMTFGGFKVWLTWVLAHLQILVVGVCFAGGALWYLVDRVILLVSNAGDQKKETRVES